MNWMKRATTIVLGLGMLAAPAAMVAQGPVGVYRSGPWEQAPNEYRQDMQRRGFQEGFQGARRDLENGRRPNVNNRDEFRNYRGPAPRLYRSAFQRGYQTFWAHVDRRRR